MAKKCVVRDTSGTQRQDCVTVCIMNNEIQFHSIFIFFFYLSIFIFNDNNFLRGLDSYDHFS